MGKRRKRRLSGFGIFLIVLFITLALFAVLAVTVLFPVKTITVEGKSQYSAEQIISASDISVGNNILLISENGVSKKVSKQLPYIASVSVKRDLRGNVVLSVKNDEKKYSCKTNEGYLIIGGSLKVLEKSEKKAKNTVTLLGVPSSVVIIGEQFKINDGSKDEIFKQIIEYSKTYDIGFSVIDLSNISDITVMMNGKIVVKFGSRDELKNKFAHLKEMRTNLDKSQKGIIDLKTWSTEKPEGYFRKQDVSKYFK